MQDIVKQIVDMDRKAREITAAVEQDRLNSEKEIAQKRVELRAEYLAKAREAIPSSESQERAAAEKEWDTLYMPPLSYKNLTCLCRRCPVTNCLCSFLMMTVSSSLSA